MNDKVNVEEYPNDIVSAILEIRKIEGDTIVISFSPSPDYEFIRYKKYPYTKSMFTSCADPIDDPKKFMMQNRALLSHRIAPYLDDFIRLDEVDV